MHSDKIRGEFAQEKSKAESMDKDPSVRWLISIKKSLLSVSCFPPPFYKFPINDQLASKETLHFDASLPSWCNSREFRLNMCALKALQK